MQGISILALTVVATSAITAERFVGHDGAPAGAGENTLGVARMGATAAGDATTVDVVGTTIVEAGAAIAAGAAIESDANGKAVTKDSGIAVARMAPGAVATAAGDRIEVLLIAN